MRSDTRRVAIIGLGAMGQVVLAGIGFEKTTVRLIADPAIKQNMHEVEVAGGVRRVWFQYLQKPVAAAA